MSGSNKAAKVLSPSRNATLTNLVLKELKAKKLPTNKNLLCQELQKWPRTHKEIEELILSKLSQILKNRTNIFKSSTNAADGNKDTKTKIRSQLEIGVSSVFRALEKGQLSCVLVSGQASPAITVDHVISLAKERCCPLLCLDQLAPTMATATETKCLPLAIGFKDVDGESEAIFKEIITLVKENVTVNQQTNVAISTPRDESARLTVGSDVKKGNVRPIDIDAKSLECIEILDELHRTLSQAVVRMIGGPKKKDRKKKKRKKNLKEAIDKPYSHQFEIGKRTVHEMLGRATLQLILISDTVAPVLVAEASRPHAASSLLELAVKRACPVLCVPGLTDMLRPLLGGCVSVIGMKKFEKLEANSKRHFESVILKCKEALQKQASIQNTSELDTKQLSESTNISAVETGVPKHQVRLHHEEEDYSHLYVFKKDSKQLKEKLLKRKAEAEREQREMTFSTDFISLAYSSGDISVSKGEKKNIAEDHPPIKKAKLDTRSGHKDSVFISLKPDLTTEPVTTNTGQSAVTIKGVQDKAKDSGFISLHSEYDNASTSHATMVVKECNGDPARKTMQDDLTGTITVDNSGMKSETSHSVDTRHLSQSETSNVSQLFLLERSGDGITSDFKKNAASKERGGFNLPVMVGDLASSKPDTSFNVLAMHKPASKGKGKKRELRNQEGYISLAYTEANIGTMVANFDKKKKKKKKKKK